MKTRVLIIVVVILAAAALGGVLYVVTRTGNAQKEEVILKGDGGKASVTPTDKMRVRTAEGQPDIDLEKYRLSVEGLVEEPLSLSFDEVKALPAEELYVELPCVEGWTEAGVWKGPKLSSLLERAGVKDEADNVVFSSPGGYTTSLTLADIKKTDPLLAYGVNGSRLPDEQGYPLRLVVPDRLGYKWIKWVTGIKVIKGSHQGFWESRGYSNDADATGR
jgi:DMSO/TMAO reductase YedYZ molybdopterin-dependent catalytic subunit